MNFVFLVLKHPLKQIFVFKFFLLTCYRFVKILTGANFLKNSFTNLNI